MPSPDISQELFNRIAQQHTWNDKGSNAILDKIIQAFGGQSIKDLPPEWQNIAKMLTYVVMNNYGDELGMMNQGNLFANMHQAILSSGPITSQGLAGANGERPFLGVTSGAGAKSVQYADIFTKIAADTYYNPATQTEDLDNTQGMSGQLFTGYAASVMKDRGVKEGDVITAVSEGRGAQALYDTANKAVKQGVSQDSDQYKAMIDIARVTEKREEMLKQHKSYKLLQEKEEKLEKYRKSDKSKLTEAQKDEYKALETSTTVLRDQIDRDVDKKLEGQTLKGKEINGKQEDDLEVTSELVDASRQQEKVGGSQFELVTKQAEKDVKEALRMGAKNVAELEKMWHTSEFADLQKAASDLAMGSLTDKNNVEKVATRIKDAQLMSAKTGRSIESIWSEQADIVSALASVYGGKKHVDQNAVMSVQRISERAAENSEKYGYGPDKETAAAEAVKQQAAYTNEAANTIDAEALLNDKDVNMTPEQREKMQALVQQYYSSSDPQEQRKIAAQLGQYVKKLTYGEGVSKEYHQKALEKYGDKATQHVSRAVQAQNADQLIDRAVNDNEKAQALGITDENREQVKQDMSSALKETSIEEQETLDALLQKGDQKGVEEYIQRQLASSGLQGEDRERYEKALRGYARLNQAQRNEVRFYHKQMAETGQFETKADEERNKLENAKGQIEDMVKPNEEIQKGGVDAFLRGVMTGDKAVSNRDAAIKYMRAKGYMDNLGKMSDEKVQELNEKDPNMAVLQIDEETKTIKNADILEKEIVTADGKRMPMWKAMGLGESLEEAKKNAKDPQKVLAGMNALKQQGYNVDALGNGNVAVTKGGTLDVIKDEMEKERASGMPRLKEAYKDYMGNFKTDKEGNIIEATMKNGEVVKGKEEVQKRMAAIARKDKKVAEQVSKIDDKAKAAYEKNKKINDMVSNMTYGGIIGDDVSAEDASKKNYWDEVEKNGGNRDNYNYWKAVRASMADAVEMLDDEKKDASGQTEKDRYEQAARAYLRETMAREEGETDEEFEERINDKIKDGLSTEEMAHVLAENKGIFNDKSEARSKAGLFYEAMGGLKAGQKKSVYDGKRWKDVDTSRVLEGESARMEQGAQLQADKITEGMKGVLGPVGEALSKLVGCVQNDTMRVKEV